MSTAEHPETVRIVSISDSESYLKWACALLSTLPQVEAHVYLVDNPILPTEEQIDHAVAGTAWAGTSIPLITRAEVEATVRRHRADIVLAASTGPIVAQIFASAHRLMPRPGLVSGLPGMGLPARAKGARYRRLADMFIANSHAEVTAYERVYAEVGVPAEVVLGRLPMLTSEGLPRLHGRLQEHERRSVPLSQLDTLVFAPQAKVPESRADRELLIRRLAALAEAHSATRVIIKGRSRPGELETHHEHHSYHEILEELQAAAVPGATAIDFAYGPMAAFLRPGAALLTVSSTAALESIDRGIPTGLISDIGFSDNLLNEAFEDSGATIDLSELPDVGVPFPSREWLEHNYFHPQDSGLRRSLELLALRSRQSQLPRRRRALFKQQRMLLRAEVRTFSPDWVVRVYRRLRWGK